MASIGKWNASSGVVSVLTTELNALANNTLSAASAAINNDTNLDVYADLEIVLGALSPTANAYLSLFLLEALDGTNYADATNLRLRTSQLLATIGLDTTASTAQRITVRNVMLPPAKFKIVLDNQAGVALAATGNTLKLLPYNVNLNG